MGSSFRIYQAQMTLCIEQSVELLLSRDEVLASVHRFLLAFHHARHNPILYHERFHRRHTQQQSCRMGVYYQYMANHHRHHRPNTQTFG
jgi:hypothetical protein